MQPELPISSSDKAPPEEVSADLEIFDGQAIPHGSNPLVDHTHLQKTWGRQPGFWGWLCTVDHKEISIRYIITTFVFFALAGILAVFMRIQLAFPELGLLSADEYNQFFSTHGTAMMFLFAVPVMDAMALYLVPLMVGTRNVAFPRLNAYGYYTFLFAGILLWGALLLNIGPDTGWFSYVPLSGPEFSPGKRVDVWSQVVTLTEIAALVAAVEIITTVLKQRAAGMSLNRIPVYVWAMVVMSFMVTFAMPAVMLGSTMLSMDRLTNVSTHFFNYAEGGDALLWQHVFWFFGHPEVYIIFIPATGFISAIIPVFCRRPIFGYPLLVLSLVSIGFIGFGLWVHHMFATPLPRMGQAFFTAASTMIAIPSGIQIFCWIATIWSGRPQFHVPLMYAIAFIVLFVLGGLSGIILASVTIDQQVHDTFFVVAHFHYVLIGGAVFPLLGAVYYWYPKWTGRLLNDCLGMWTLALMFIGFNLTFFPMHQLGLKGMPRRIYTYVPGLGWEFLNRLATIGGAVMGVALAMYLVNVIWSARRGRLAGANPWGADSLEWATSSPPKPYNFLYLRAVTGRNPLWEDTVETPVISGISTHKREVLSTTFLEGKPEHRYELCTDSIWPFVTAVITAGICYGVVFHPIAVPIGAALMFFSLLLWFWRESEPNLGLKREADEDEEPKDKSLLPPDSLHHKSAKELEEEGKEEGEYEQQKVQEEEKQ